MYDLLNLLANYLNEYLNYGVYNGVTGSHIEIIMKLDIGLQLVSLISTATHLSN